MTRVVALAVLLAGCAADAGTVARDTGACRVKRAQSLVGQMQSPAVLAEAKRRSGATAARFLGPDQIVTMEYRAGRINLVTDAAGRVVAVRCG